MSNHRIFALNTNFAVSLGLVVLAGCGSSGSGALTSNSVDLCLVVCDRMVTAQSCILAQEVPSCVSGCRADVGSISIRPACQDKLDSFATCIVAHQTCDASGKPAIDEAACEAQSNTLFECEGSSVGSSNTSGNLGTGGAYTSAAGYASTGGKTAGAVVAASSTGGYRATGGYSAIKSSGGAATGYISGSGSSYSTGGRLGT